MTLSKLFVFMLAGCVVLALTACNDNSKKGSPTATKPAATAAKTSPGATSTPPAVTGATTPSATFEGGRDPVTGTLTTGQPAPAPAQLTDVRIAAQPGFDRATFEFEGADTTYRVQPVDSPAQCASGEPVPLEGENAAIEVKFTPAATHNEQATPTFAQTTIDAGLQAIVRAVQTCDFEADVTWVLIVRGELNFKVTALNDGRLAVDVEQP